MSEKKAIRDRYGEIIDVDAIEKEETDKKKSKPRLILGAILAVILLAGPFYMDFHATNYGSESGKAIYRAYKGIRIGADYAAVRDALPNSSWLVAGERDNEYFYRNPDDMIAASEGRELRLVFGEDDKLAIKEFNISSANLGGNSYEHRPRMTRPEYYERVSGMASLASIEKVLGRGMEVRSEATQAGRIHIQKVWGDLVFLREIRVTCEGDDVLDITYSSNE